MIVLHKIILGIYFSHCRVLLDGLGVRNEDTFASQMDQTSWVLLYSTRKIRHLVFCRVGIIFLLFILSLMHAA